MMHPNQAAPSLGDDLLTEGEAARLRRQSKRTLQAERLRGGGCPYVKLGRSVRYRKSDVLAFIEANLRNAAEPPGDK
jgi:Helix-turn-helix domain